MSIQKHMHHTIQLRLIQWQWTAKRGCLLQHGVVCIYTHETNISFNAPVPPHVVMCLLQHVEVCIYTHKTNVSSNAPGTIPVAVLAAAAENSQQSASFQIYYVI